MAKGKSANPADAFRKAQRAKELKKNKEDRKKTRETQTIKKDTRDLESEIRQLKSESKLNGNAKAKLASLESELAHINTVKESYVAEHPEARDRVFRTPGKGKERDGQTQKQDLSHLYDEDGKLRDPTRSVYFDPVYNPFGVPPPGMPYRERSPAPGEDDDEDDEDDDDDSDDIAMPEGPPPGADDDDDSDDSDDMPLPDGPPPPKDPPPIHSSPYPPIPPFSAGPHPPFPPHDIPYFPQTAQPSFRPPRPYVSRDRAPNMVQDPLSDSPTQTYQAYQIGKHELPPKPISSSAVISSAPSAPSSAEANGSSLPVKPRPDPEAGTISAAPVLRDLRKEATAFVPRGVKRKKPVGGVTVNAAPGSGDVDEDGDSVRVKRAEQGGGLMGKLKGVLDASSGPTAAPGRNGANGSHGGDEEYQRFLDGLGDLA